MSHPAVRCCGRRDVFNYAPNFWSFPACAIATPIKYFIGILPRPPFKQARSPKLVTKSGRHVFAESSTGTACRAPTTSQLSAGFADRPVDERLFGTAATVALAVASGASIVRVHDVKEMRDVVRMTEAVLPTRAPDAVSG